MLYRLVVGAAALLVGLSGCSSGPSTASVKGDVRLNGEPVEAGSISFIPSSGEGTKVAAAIENGKYEIAADRAPAPGSYKVEITWDKPTGRKIPSADPGMQTDERREAIPAKYNTQTTLVEELTAGENVKNFTLTSP